MTYGTYKAETYRRHLSDLLLAGAVGPEAIDDIVDAGLASLALQHLQAKAERPKGSAADLLNDPRLRSARSTAAARHAAVRSLTATLLASWRAAGIEALLFKGFYLAEFVYPEPSWRPYSDVDIALRDLAERSPDELAGAAAAVAAELGWEVIWRHGEQTSIGAHHDEGYQGHELLLLRHHLGVAVDAHRRLVHSNVPSRSRVAKAEQISAAVWEASTPADLADAKVRLPSAVDAALIGLITARSWSGDRYDLRPHDLLDLEALMKLGRFGTPELLGRAVELGVGRTTKLFLRRCDPTGRVLDLRPPTSLEVLWYDTILLTERGHRGLERWLADLARQPSRIAATARELPHVAGRLGAWRAQGVSDRRPPAPQQAQELSRRSWRLRQFAVRRALQLLGAPPQRNEALALACLHDSLLRHGHEVRLISSGGRSWLEYQGAELPLDVLGVHDPNAAKQGLWSLPGRLARIGWRGLRLRLEALIYLRRVVRRLEAEPFKLVREGLINSVAPVARRAPSGTRATAKLNGDALGPRSTGRAVESAARYVPGALCVAQSLTAQLMLAKRGAGSTIHFGFLRGDSGQVEGHAWLEVEGEVVTGDVGLENFTRTATFEVT